MGSADHVHVVRAATAREGLEELVAAVAPVRRALLRRAETVQRRGDPEDGHAEPPEQVREDVPDLRTRMNNK